MDYSDYLQEIGDLKVMTVMATTQEYGECLKAEGVKPLITGVGPIECAVSLTRALASLQHEDKLPDLVMNIGSAGSQVLEQSEIYHVSSSGYRDMDATYFGVDKGKSPFSAYPAIISFPQRISGLKQASASTGGNVVSGPGYDGIEADMVEMECHAVTHACMEYGVPVIGVKGISDGKEALTGQMSEWEEYLPVIDKKLAAVYEGLRKGLENDTISKDNLLAMPPQWHYVQAVRSVQQAEASLEDLRPLLESGGEKVAGLATAIKCVVGLVTETAIEDLMPASKKLVGQNPEAGAFLDNGEKAVGDLFAAIRGKDIEKPKTLEEGGVLRQFLEHVSSGFEPEQARALEKGMGTIGKK